MATAGEGGGGKGPPETRQRVSGSISDVIEENYKNIEHILQELSGLGGKQGMVAGCFNYRNSRLVVFDGLKENPNTQTDVLKAFIDFDQVGDFRQNITKIEPNVALKTLIDEIHGIDIHKKYSHDRSKLFDELFDQKVFETNTGGRQASKDKVVQNIHDDAGETQSQNLSSPTVATPSQQPIQVPTPGWATGAIGLMTPYAKSIIEEKGIQLAMNVIIGENKNPVDTGEQLYVPYMSQIGMVDGMKNQPFFDFTEDWFTNKFKKYREKLEKLYPSRPDLIASYISHSKRFSESYDKIVTGKGVLEAFSQDSEHFNPFPFPRSIHGRKWINYCKTAQLVKVRKESGMPLEAQIQMLNSELLLDPCSYKPIQLLEESTTEQAQMGAPKDYKHTPGSAYASLGCSGQFRKGMVKSMNNNIPFLYDFEYNQGIFIMCNDNGEIEVIIYEKYPGGEELYLFPSDILLKEGSLKVDKKTLSEILLGKRAHFTCNKVTVQSGIPQAEEPGIYPPVTNDSGNNLGESMDKKYRKMLMNAKSFDDICKLLEHLSYQGNSELFTGDNALGILALILNAYEKGEDGKWKKVEFGDVLKSMVITASRGSETSRKLVSLNSNPKDVSLLKKVQWGIDIIKRETTLSYGKNPYILKFISGDYDLVLGDVIISDSDGYRKRIRKTYKHLQFNGVKTNVPEIPPNSEAIHPEDIMKKSNSVLREDESMEDKSMEGISMETRIKKILDSETMSDKPRLLCLTYSVYVKEQQKATKSRLNELYDDYVELIKGLNKFNWNRSNTSRRQWPDVSEKEGNIKLLVDEYRELYRGLLTQEIADNFMDIIVKLSGLLDSMEDKEALKIIEKYVENDGETIEGLMNDGDFVGKLDSLDFELDLDFGNDSDDGGAGDDADDELALETSMDHPQGGSRRKRKTKRKTKKKVKRKTKRKSNKTKRKSNKTKRKSNRTKKKSNKTKRKSKRRN